MEIGRWMRGRPTRGAWGRVFREAGRRVGPDGVHAVSGSGSRVGETSPAATVSAGFSVA